ncbi:hypothetical protein MPSEU_001020300 [Mayamaea pseudoterrestris]|nr:hypothetical protein MPSEU_001020300 [Mayamaea pseudoterrestris]
MSDAPEQAAQTEETSYESSNHLDESLESKLPTPGNHDDEEARLDFELHLIQKLNMAFSASLHMFESVHNGLDDLGTRIDRLTESSRKCREALAQKRADMGNERR